MCNGSNSLTTTQTRSLPQGLTDALNTSLSHTLGAADTPFAAYGNPLAQGLTNTQWDAATKYAQLANAGAQMIGAHNAPDPGVVASNPLAWKGEYTAAAPSGINGYQVSAPGASYAGDIGTYGITGQHTGAPGTIGTNAISGPMQDVGGLASMTGQLMNPYIGGVVQTSLADLNRQLAQTNSAARGQAALSGAFGGDRASIVETENQRNANDIAAKTIAGLYSQGYGQALGAAQGIQNANQQVGLQALLANQQDAYRVGAQNVANQMQAGQFNAGQDQAALLANQNDAYRTAASNQAARQGLAQFNATQGLQAGLANQGNDFAAQQANANLFQQRALFNAGQALTMDTANQADAYRTGALNVANRMGNDQFNSTLNSTIDQANQRQILGQQGINLQGAAGWAQAGGLEQAALQRGLDTSYQEFLRGQSYPYQQAQFLSGGLGGLANAFGSTTSTTSPGPSTLGQLAGLGTTGLGLAGALGAFGSGNGSSGGGLLGAAGSGVSWLGKQLGIGGGDAASALPSNYADLSNQAVQSGQGFWDSNTYFSAEPGMAYARGGLIEAYDAMDETFVPAYASGGAVEDYYYPDDLGLPGLSYAPRPVSSAGLAGLVPPTIEGQAYEVNPDIGYQDAPPIQAGGWQAGLGLGAYQPTLGRAPAALPGPASEAVGTMLPTVDVSAPAYADPATFAALDYTPTAPDAGSDPSRWPVPPIPPSNTSRAPNGMTGAPVSPEIAAAPTTEAAVRIAAGVDKPGGLAGMAPAASSDGGISPWMPLMAAGLGMMASKSPTALGAVGEGGLAGLNQAMQMQKAERDQRRLDQQQAYHNALVGVRQGQVGVNQQNANTRAAGQAARTDYQEGRLGIEKLRADAADRRNDIFAGVSAARIDALNAQAQRYAAQAANGGGGRPPAAVQTAEYLRRANPDLSPEQAMAVANGSAARERMAVQRSQDARDLAAQRGAASAANADVRAGAQIVSSGMARPAPGGTAGGAALQTVRELRSQSNRPPAAATLPSARAAPLPAAQHGDVLAAARAAISQGKDPEAVRARLRQYGVDPSGL